ncbi:MAG: hypothetical protein KF761_07450 [Salinibacterium sp.]|nr:hypothetical protein [Salinibacterium sp.]
MQERLSPERIDALWDFGDPAASAERFAREPATSAKAGAELATQRARALGLDGRGSEAHALLDGIVVTDPLVATRVALERGRLLNSAGRADEAVPLFAEALRCAQLAADDFLTVDALHMLAIADEEHSDEWMARGIRVIEGSMDARTQRWGIALHNNRGWRLFDSGLFAEALAEFELAAVNARDHGTAQQKVWAQEAIDEARQALTAPPQ